MRARAASVVAVGLLVTLSAPALARQPPEPGPAYDDPVALTFPVAGPVRYTDSYDACRSGCRRRHRATDIMVGEVGRSVHAAVDGVVTWVTGLEEPVPWYGYLLRLAGDDGRRYVYIHLGRQDGPPAAAYAPGIVRGARVRRGEVLGYAGCSGNASCDAPHLHFEIHDDRVTDPYGGHRVNPYRSLRTAERRGHVPEAAPRAIPVVGDPDGDGRDQPGWYVDGSVTWWSTGGPAAPPSEAPTGQTPVVGDWDGDATDTVGAIDDGVWQLSSERSPFVFGRVGQDDVAVTGDWNGDGIDGIGVVRGERWYVRRRPGPGPAARPTVFPPVTGGYAVVGDWDGDGRDQRGVVVRRTWLLSQPGRADAAFTYGSARHNDVPVAGDWDGDGVDTVGVVRDGRWFLRDALAGGRADTTITFPPP